MRNISDPELGAAIWHKSSYSEGGGGNCLEVHLAHPSPSPLIPVRDSKTPLGPKLVFRAASWSLFIENLKRD
ncbi:MULTISPECIES: DUF397 domain-containing protein [Streptomyces]|uniref:DUF397 domain-containing protein n=1 Tax=Streptomyces caniscabiei TaxID=2746961 RepID=A0ABU4MUP8_9ACTN|nr:MULTISPECIES: DUF397 domain-containing protein [Streptomyces]MBE4738185.1 DUF397 domain-containing protein [Streptomyces caniscabiei]MBE4756947.1 DUF397 domain-containing protein [Streptomyces caniscabiei]MBE4773887.1 DUF397 domain-containing protein [Streptomyces caniscabiei]MBE4785543.1 DUF397 domain-containing protein [Streptomyces caniscabiei]MBE4796885.1 DUF397 domain-containing protein [Streptomyces caniscabiei]